MGNLPAARLTPNFPFECSGVDYAGPISMRILSTKVKVLVKVISPCSYVLVPEPFIWSLSKITLQKPSSLHFSGSRLVEVTAENFTATAAQTS